MNTLFSTLRLLFASILFSIVFSCDDDVSDVGAETLIGTEIDLIEDSENEITLTQMSSNPIQTNSQSINFLGIDNDPVFGSTSYGILAEVAPAILSSIPAVNDSTTISIDNIELILPYAYRLKSTSDQERVYEIDSIFNVTEPLQVEVFQSIQELILTSTTTNSPQRYYSNASDDINEFGDLIVGDNNNLVDTDNSNPFSALPMEDELTIDLRNDDGSAIENPEELPGYRIKLKNTIFDAILEGSEENDFTALSNNDFTDKFRGIYLNPIMDVTKGLIGIPRLSTLSGLTPRIEITFDVKKADEDPTTEIAQLNITGQTINIINPNIPATITNNQSGNSIFVKGGPGTIAKISLFNSEELEELLDNNLIVNGAELKFTVNKEASQIQDVEDLPAIMINELETGRRLLDYNGAVSITQANTEIVNEDVLRIIHLPLPEEENGEFVYTINVTDHIQRILNQDSLEDAETLNTKLALSVTADIRENAPARIKNQTAEQFVTIGTPKSIKGVVLYGNGDNVEDIKKPKLIIKSTAAN